MVCTVAVSQTHRIAKPSLILGAPTEHIGRWANTCISVSVPHTLLLCCFSCPCLRDSVGYLADSKLSLSIMCWTDDGRSHLRVITCNQQRERTEQTVTVSPTSLLGFFSFTFAPPETRDASFTNPSPSPKTSQLNGHSPWLHSVELPVTMSSLSAACCSSRFRLGGESPPSSSLFLFQDCMSPLYWWLFSRPSWLRTSRQTRSAFV